MGNISEKTAEILTNKLQISLNIAKRVGEQVSEEDVSVLIVFAAELFEDSVLKTSASEGTDYSEYDKYIDNDLPDFIPFKTGKGGRKAAPVRKFMMYFFPIVEFMMSSEHGRIRMREKSDKWANLTPSEEFEQLNKVGQLGFLITRLFFPEVDMKNDVRSILQPIKGQLPYWATRAEKQNPVAAEKFKRTDEKPGEAWLRTRPYEVELDVVQPKLDEIRQQLRQYK